MELRSGQVFADDYRVVRELGRGGMGAVYLVEQLSTEKRRALKLMSPGLLSDAKAAERFLQEAKVGGKVASDHIVEVIAAGIERSGDRPVPWLVMELLEGESLHDAVSGLGAMSRERVHEILRQLCHGLGAAHRAGLVHRDVKPDNVFLAESKTAGEALKVKLLDFGIAKVLEPTVDGQGSTTAPMGTPLFMAPEQTHPGPVDARADVWALGLLAYYMLTGRHYWKAANEPGVPLTALLVELSVDTIVPPSERAREQGTSVPEAFDAWFLQCVDRDVEARYSNADVAWKALSGRLSGDAFAPTLASDQLAAATDPGTPIATDLGTGAATPTPASTGTATEPAPAEARSTGSGPEAPPAAGSRMGPIMIGAGALMLAAGGIAIGWSIRSDDRVASVSVVDQTPTEATRGGPAEGEDEAMTPLGPDAGPGSDAGAPEEVAGVDPPEEVPDSEPESQPRPEPRGHPRDHVSREQFISTAQLQCRTWAANNGGRVRVRVRQWLDAHGARRRWQVRPAGLAACLAQSAGYVPWPGTGQPRQMTISFVIRYP